MCRGESLVLFLETSHGLGAATRDGDVRSGYKLCEDDAFCDGEALNNEPRDRGRSTMLPQPRMAIFEVGSMVRIKDVRFRQGVVVVFYYSPTYQIA